MDISPCRGDHNPIWVAAVPPQHSHYIFPVELDEVTRMYF